MEIPDSVKYIIEMLRNAMKSSDTPATPPPSTDQSSTKLFPLEQRRDGYRQYLNEFKAGVQEGTPLPYEQWIAQQEK